MMHYQPYLPDTERRGVVLLVVIVMLALFATVGVTFVFYAEASSAQSNSQRQSLIDVSPNIDAEMAFTMFLEQLLFGVPDDGRGVYSALRGHDLQRNLWGMNYDFVNGVNGPISLNNNTVAFNGSGRLHYPIQVNGQPIDPNINDNYQFINYTYFPGDGFLRDPGRFGVRAGLAAPRGAYVEEFNASYTYPDLNSLFLAAVNKDGVVLMPSFHRPWLFGSNDPNNNPNWTNKVGKYLTLRPRPIDNAVNGVMAFPYPEDAFGDVQNLKVPGVRKNDSYWMNINAPVFRLPDGRKYTMLVAPLIIDLDGKVNLNVHGNMKGYSVQQLLGLPANSIPPHASNHGWYAWEVNLGRVLPAPDASGRPEWLNLFLGRPGAKANTLQVIGKYGPDQVPRSPLGTANPGRNDHVYAQTDPDAALTFAPDNLPQQLQLPGYGGASGAPPLSIYPWFHSRYANGSTQERTNHPALYRALSPLYAGPTDYDRNFRVSNLEKFLRYYDTNTDSLTTELLRLSPGNFDDAKNPNGAQAAARARRLVTLLSANLDRAGATPSGWPANGTNVYASINPQTNQPDATKFPSGPALPYPTPPNGVTGGADIGPDWRSQLAALAKVDLRRDLTPYPLYDTQQGIQTPASSNSRCDDPQNTFFDTTRFSSAAQQFVQAQADRQTLANDLYRRLLAVCNVPAVVNPAAPTDDELVPRRWLAQLAVNIVDYIDEDDVSTPFNFYNAQDGLDPSQIGVFAKLPADNTKDDPERPRYWVFGTELPRLVINEAIGQYRSTVIPTSPIPTTMFVELCNPFEVPPANNPNKILQRQDGYAVPLFVNAVQQSAIGPGFQSGFAPYKVVIADAVWAGQGVPQFKNDNVLGKPNQVRTEIGAATTGNVLNDFDPTKKQVQQYGNPANVLPSEVATQPTPPQASQQGFFLVGPPTGTNLINSTTSPAVPPAAPIVRTANAQYPAQAANGVNADAPNGVSVLLRRLANPHLPPNPNPTKTVVNNGQPTVLPNEYYNPYVTVDYLDHVPLYDSRTQPQAQSLGRRQPFGAFYKVLFPNNNPTVAPAQDSPVALTGVPQGQAGNYTAHTFGGTNNVPPVGQLPFYQPNGKPAYQWLTHLDRKPVSPIEILQVSMLQPHQLTQQFIVGDDSQAANRFLHTAPWFNPANRLWGLFEYLQCRPPGGWLSYPGGRLTGQININTIWDQEAFLALCDALAAPGAAGPVYFTDADVQNVYGPLILRRTPGLARVAAPAVGPVDMPNVINDRPFLSLATGPTAGGAGAPRQFNRDIDDTLFRRATDPFTNTLKPVLLLSDKLSDGSTVPGQHPFLKAQLLSKIFNNVTVRSNTFAVFLTVGFFEVLDDSTLPVKLGAELGRDQNRQIRHRMFAVIDRTQPQTVFSTTASQAISAGQAVVKPAAMAGTTAQGHAWSIVPGTVLTIDTAGTPETVVVTATLNSNPKAPPGTPPDSFVATFAAAHALTNGAVTIAAVGHPGPRNVPFNPHNSSLIAHFSIIE